MTAQPDPCIFVTSVNRIFFMDHWNMPQIEFLIGVPG